MSNSPGTVTPKPPSLEKRLPLALALMMLVLLVSQYLFKPAPGPKPVQHVNDKTAAKITEKPPVPAVLPAVAPGVTAAGGQMSAAAESDYDIDTALYHIVFTNRGGVVKSWVLKKYQDESGKPLQFVNSSAKDVPLPFAIEIKNQKVSVDPNTVLYQAKPSADGVGIDYVFSDGQTTIRKSFVFAKDSYLAEVKSQVLMNNTAVPHFLLWRGGFGDLRVRNAAQSEHTVRYDASAGKLITKTAKDAKDGPLTDTGNYTFGG
jgi:YidC/Oxa1 family membrane protein insertase